MEVDYVHRDGSDLCGDFLDCAGRVTGPPAVRSI